MRLTALIHSKEAPRSIYACEGKTKHQEYGWQSNNGGSHVTLDARINNSFSYIERHIFFGIIVVTESRVWGKMDWRLRCIIFFSFSFSRMNDRNYCYFWDLGRAKVRFMFVLSRHPLPISEPTLCPKVPSWDYSSFCFSPWLHRLHHVQIGSRL
jgi:hypothetical protein